MADTPKSELPSLSHDRRGRAFASSGAMGGAVGSRLIQIQYATRIAMATVERKFLASLS